MRNGLETRRNSPNGEQTALTMLGEAGFTSIDALRRDGDFVNAYIIASKG